MTGPRQLVVLSHTHLPMVGRGIVLGSCDPDTFNELWREVCLERRPSLLDGRVKVPLCLASVFGLSMLLGARGIHLAICWGGQGDQQRTAMVGILVTMLTRRPSAPGYFARVSFSRRAVEQLDSLSHWQVECCFVGKPMQTSAENSARSWQAQQAGMLSEQSSPPESVGKAAHAKPCTCREGDRLPWSSASFQRTRSVFVDQWGCYDEGGVEGKFHFLSV